MRCNSLIVIYFFLGLQLISPLTVQGLPLPNYDLIDPVSSSSSSSSSGVTQMPPEPEPDNFGFAEESTSLPIKRSGKIGSPVMMVNRHHPLRFLIGQMIQSPETLDGPYQRGRRYRDHDKSFIRFGRAAVQKALALWSRESRKRPEQNNDTYFLRFGRSSQ
ncbi:uncharacterized protein LOC107367206 [Tetranychus urticae]|uniref:Corticotropin-releasing factor domain-containing protein n=1 Tax=Tetranychus urticae TaxID=32264 RepID=T1KUH4_TETUR|nr:uncharacterized protein LOC107367206 [Tetranychus urticae]